MPNDHPDRPAASRRGGAFGDVHDIRALTDTGAIAVPLRSGSQRSSTRRAARAVDDGPAADVA